MKDEIFDIKLFLRFNLPQYDIKQIPISSDRRTNDRLIKISYSPIPNLFSSPRAN